MEPRYRRMIRGMAARAGRKGRDRRAVSQAAKSTQAWLLYILSCVDGSLYTGITNDLVRRLKMHSSGRASRYTRSRLPVKLVYQERCPDRVRALIRECAVKDLGRTRKLELIRSSRGKPKRFGGLRRRRVER